MQLARSPCYPELVASNLHVYGGMSIATGQTARTLADPDRDGMIFVYDLVQAPRPPLIDGATPRAATAADAVALQVAMAWPPCVQK